jgi:hypothetical protein
MDDVDAGEQLEQFTGEVELGAGARRAVVQFAGL